MNVQNKLERSLNSVLINLQGIQHRCLLDSGSDKSLIHERVFNSLQKKELLKRNKISLQSANGSEVKVLGETNLNFKIGGIKIEQKFTIVSNLNRNIILGSDFLEDNDTRIYYDLKQIRIKGCHYIPFERDLFVSSIARMSKTTVMKPHTTYLVKAQLKISHPFNPKSMYNIEKLDKGFISEQPELQFSDSISNLNDHRFFPIQITNTSGKFIKIKRGCVLGKINEVNIINNIKSKTVQPTEKEFKDMISTDKEHFDKVANLLCEYRDTFAFSDADLVGTDLMVAEIDTRDNKPVNIKPYRTPLALQKIVGERLEEMLDTGIIRPSISPWCAPIVVIEKKPDSTGIKPPPRIAIDYRALNKCIYPVSYPIPRIDDTLGKLNGSTFFSSLDLRAGFHQVLLTPEAAEKNSV